VTGSSDSGRAPQEVVNDLATDFVRANRLLIPVLVGHLGVTNGPQVATSGQRVGVVEDSLMLTFGQLAGALLLFEGRHFGASLLQHRIAVALEADDLIVGEPAGVRLVFVDQLLVLGLGDQALVGLLGPR
jgi:hypothetical protein